MVVSVWGDMRPDLCMCVWCVAAVAQKTLITVCPVLCWRQDNIRTQLLSELCQTSLFPLSKPCYLSLFAILPDPSSSSGKINKPPERTTTTYHLSTSEKHLTETQGAFTIGAHSHPKKLQTAKMPSNFFASNKLIINTQLFFGICSEHK